LDWIFLGLEIKESKPISSETISKVWGFRTQIQRFQAVTYNIQNKQPKNFGEPFGAMP
jgi:hypothetical protein